MNIYTKKIVYLQYVINLLLQLSIKTEFTVPKYHYFDYFNISEKFLVSEVEKVNGKTYSKYSFNSVK